LNDRSAIWRFRTTKGFDSGGGWRRLEAKFEWRRSIYDPPRRGRIAGAELQWRAGVRLPQKGIVADPKFSEQAQCAADAQDRGQHRHDHQAQIRKHSTSRTPRAIRQYYGR
jgi:hypothetical protein